MIAIAETGLKSGMGPKRMRPAAASAASTSVGMICRNAGREASYPAKKSASTSATTSSMSSADCAMPASESAAITTGTSNSTGPST